MSHHNQISEAVIVMVPAMAARRLLERLVVTYGTRFPEHRGKWRLLTWYVNSGHLPCRLGHAKLTRLERRGFVFDLDLEDYVDRWIYVSGFFERDDYLTLMRLLDTVPGAVAFDIGAHIGFYTLGFSRAIGRTGRVHSFEPNPSAFRRLNQHVLNNRCDNVAVNNVALGAAHGRRQLFVPAHSNTGGATLLDLCAQPDVLLQPVDVDVTSLDTYCADKNISRLDLVKIDCQGYEPHILEGGHYALREFRPRLQLEFDPDFFRVSGWQGTTLLTYLAALDYRVCRVLRGRLLPVTAADLEQTLNLHCIPTRRQCSPHIPDGDSIQARKRRQ